MKEIKSVVDSQSSRVPVLPEKVDPFLMCLSPEDIRELSPDSCAQQVPSLSHIVVKGRDMMYKLVYDTEEEMGLNKLYYMAASLNHHHFIVPELGHLIHEFKYSQVPYGPLTVLYT